MAMAVSYDSNMETVLRTLEREDGPGQISIGLYATKYIYMNHILR